MIHPKYSRWICLFLGIILCTASCGDDEEMIDCESLTFRTDTRLIDPNPTKTIFATGEHIDQLVKISNKGYLVSTYEQNVWFVENGEAEQVLTDVIVNDFHSVLSIGYLCTNKGMFVFDSRERTLGELNQYNCSGFVDGLQDIYFTVGDANGGLDPSVVYEFAINGVRAVTEPYDFPIQQTIISEGGLVTVHRTPELTLIRHDSSGRVDEFTPANAPLANLAQDEELFIDYVPFIGVVVASKAELANPRIALWRAAFGTWIDLLPPATPLWGTDDPCGLEANLMAPTYTDMLANTRGIFFTTEGGGCRGLHYWGFDDIALTLEGSVFPEVNEPFAADDFSNLRPASITAADLCLEGLVEAGPATLLLPSAPIVYSQTAIYD